MKATFINSFINEEEVVKFCSKVIKFVEDQTIKLSFLKLVDLYATLYKEIYTDFCIYTKKYAKEFELILLTWTRLINEGLSKSKGIIMENPEMMKDAYLLKKKYKSIFKDIEDIQ